MMVQNPLFSSIYIVGTSMALALSMLYYVLIYVQIAPMYPEHKRDMIAYISTVVTTAKDSYDNWSQGSLSYSLIEQHLRHMKNAAYSSAQTNMREMSAFDTEGRDIKVGVKFTDPEFFKVFDLEFVQGVPFSQSDFESGIHSIAISSNLAKLLFGPDDNAVGRTVSLEFTDYMICGVYRPGSAVHKYSFADALIPYTVDKSFVESASYTGPLKLVMITDDIDALKRELTDIGQRLSAANPDKDVHFFDQPEIHAVSVLKNNVYQSGFSWSYILIAILPGGLAFLLVPALNLSGMITGRMEMRQQEIGIRKSFGATRGRLLSQVLWENLLLTLIGGVCALAIAWSVLYFGGNALYGDILQLYYATATGLNITPDMLFSPGVFVIMFCVCLILNMLSALIPAWNALRHPIVQSLHD
ncbi:MAG: FtsX-like permease family protein [Muribaculaceae bacterium]|nr:FtsX-like permease family protein [Muribaculaceae bacterium]